jgi:hypothetical protein
MTRVITFDPSDDMDGSRFLHRKLTVPSPSFLCELEVVIDRVQSAFWRCEWSRIAEPEQLFTSATSTMHRQLR